MKLQLQNLSDWLKESSTAAKGAAELTLESGLLKDSLKDLGDVGGVAGALFKLGSKAIPDPTPEERIASRLLRTFLTALDRELKEHPIEPQVWKQYLQERLPHVTTQKLSGEFTWLSIFGSRGRKPGRSWPIVGELADLGRTWVADMTTLEGRPPEVVHQLADDVRGRIHEVLAKEIDKLQNDPAIQQAMTEALSRVDREALDLLAQELTTLKKYRLFGEIPQDTVYISPRLKIADLRESPEELDWEKIPPVPDGDDLLFQIVRQKRPRLLILEGEMGAGKSCLMRVLASRLSEQFRSDRRHAPIYVRWRDIFSETDLYRAIAEQLEAEYNLPFHESLGEGGIVYLIDGFDEMSSHQEGYMLECFSRLTKLGRRNCSVVVAMRSTAITAGLRRVWKAHEALTIQIQEFDNSDVDAWAERWSTHTGAEVAGNRLRALFGSRDQSATQNPLLLYMLAKYVHPVARERQGLTRTEVFRIFVDETIRGKLRASREDFPLHFSERDYRLLLQEIAWLASWPNHAPKCPVRLIRERIPKPFLRDLNFVDIRTAFVLHFFEPGDRDGNEFEFQPEGFRHYLLAEWCVRAQLEALQDESHPSHPLWRTREKAIDGLAQLHVREEERRLIGELYEELGRLSRKDQSVLEERLSVLGMHSNRRKAGSDSLRQLYDRVRHEAEQPPERHWRDEGTEAPEGEEVPVGLEPLRRLLNYWDQCMMATVALYRGLGKDPKIDRAFGGDSRTFARFLRAREVIRGVQAEPWDLSYFDLRKCDLMRVNLRKCSFTGADLKGANLSGAVLVEADLTRTNLEEADLTSADLTGADLRLAYLGGANVTGANMESARVRATQILIARGQPGREPRRYLSLYE